MSFAKGLGRRAAKLRVFVLRSVVEALIGFALVDLVLALLFDGTLLGWVVVLLVECGFLAADVIHSAWTARKALEPMNALTMAAQRLKDNALEADSLRRLARRLEQVDEHTMTQSVMVAGAGKELGELADAIQDMLERIDTGYQAQLRFTSDVSHELRTPIAVIQGYARMLNRWGKEDPQILEESVEAILQEANDMADLVERLLFLARGDNETQRVDMAAVDLTGLVGEVARETALVAAGYTVDAAIAPEVTVTADAGLVKECLRVLCDNARKYTPEGGAIHIALTADEREARISVRDTGIGIAPEDLTHIFERFYRAENSRSRATGGTGLGLSIADWIARRHGGAIEVESAPGQGSTFTLVLPKEPEPEG